MMIANKPADMSIDTSLDTTAKSKEPLLQGK